MAKYEYDYPHPAVATDCVVFGFDGHELKVLLIQRGIEPYKGMWAFPGGFMRIDETAEECAIRELREETGLVLKHIRQLGAFSGVHRDPRERIVSIAFYALARQSEVKAGDDAATARWWSINDIPQLAFDHDFILRQATQRIRQDIHFEPIGFGLLEEHFTIAELQRLYECILGVHFDRRNFYRKMLQTGILQEVDEKPQPHYYGKHQEMKQKDFDSLFSTVEPMPTRPMTAPAPMMMEDSAPPRCEASSFDDAEESIRSHTAGRKGKLFRFNKEKYDHMKGEDSFRMEW